MKSTNLTTLKINKLTKAQYEAALAAGTVNENEFYMTPEGEPESDVFIGEYGTVTYDEIDTAYKAGKTCFIRYKNLEPSTFYILLSLVKQEDDFYAFSAYEEYLNKIFNIKIYSDGSTDIFLIPCVPEFDYDYSGKFLTIDNFGELQFVDIVQPDWNINDSTSASYVKNRPFYTGDLVETYVVQDESLVFSDSNDSLKLYNFSSSFNLVSGTTYKVYWNGVVYECVCSVPDDSAFVIGNLSIAQLGNDTGEPFLIFTDNQSIYQCYTTDTADSIVVSIIFSGREIVKIDEKYLPESAFTNAEWNCISERPIEDSVHIGISVSSFTQTFGGITTGGVYSDKLFDDELLLEEGYTYYITGTISLVSKDIGNTYSLDISDYFTCESKGRLKLGRIYSPFHDAHSDITLYGSNTYSNKNTLHFSGYNFSGEQTITVTDFNIFHKTKTLDKKYVPNLFLSNEDPKGTGRFSLNRLPNSSAGFYSFAEGYMCDASGKGSHAEGNYTEASGDWSHSEGSKTVAFGEYSHTEGFHTISSSLCQHVQGRCNLPDSSNTYLHIVGNGRDFASRSNASTLDWSGNAWFSGDVYTGSTSGKNKDEGSKKLATEDYVNKFKPTVTTYTLIVSKWDSTAKTYSFESTYPSASYDIEVALDSTATTAQAEAFNGAQIVGSATSNVVKSYGIVPTVDIPIIVKAVQK